MRYHNIRSRHELSGKVVKVLSKDKKMNGKKVIIEDWCCNLSGKLCTDNCNANNYACMNYILREDDCELPLDNNVVYVKDCKTGLGYIIHTSEIKEVVTNKSIINRFKEFIKRG